jgi:hypothetical protein
MDSKSGGTTPARWLERARLDAGQGGLEGLDGIGVDHRLMSLLVRDDLAGVDQLVSFGPADPEVRQALFERDQPPTRGRHFLRLARHLHVLELAPAEYSRGRSRLNVQTRIWVLLASFSRKSAAGRLAICDSRRGRARVFRMA